MRVPVFILTIALGSIVTLQAWMLSQIYSLSQNVAGLTAKVELLAATASPQKIAKQ